jgi:hypothetical protein
MSLSVDSSPEENSGSSRRVLLLAAVSIASAGLVLFLWLGSGRHEAPSTPMHLPFGPVERSYAPSIHIDNTSLSRAENYLHQQVTTLQADLVNSGDRSVQGVEITVEFADEMNQVVLRQSLISSAPRLLEPKGSREFEISFERIPSSWNRQSPVINVTGLELARQK